MSKDNKCKLIPCPFCGAADLLQTDKMVQEIDEEAAEALAYDEHDDKLEDEWFVVCGDCGAMGPMSPSAGQAQAAWNRRA